jgi:hypothetical protein
MSQTTQNTAATQKINCNQPICNIRRYNFIIFWTMKMFHGPKSPHFWGCHRQDIMYKAILAPKVVHGPDRVAAIISDDLPVIGFG